jgi:hypothetical protein
MERYPVWKCENDNSVQLNKILCFNMLTQQLQEPITVSTRKLNSKKKTQENTYMK